MCAFGGRHPGRPRRAGLALDPVPRAGLIPHEDVVQFLDWALAPAACPEESIVVMLDWFSAHLSTEVAELVASKGHVLLFHGGGVTGLEQVNAAWLSALFACVPNVVVRA